MKNTNMNNEVVKAVVEEVKAIPAQKTKKEEKLSKREYFGILKKLVEESKASNKDDLLGFINHEVELLDRKSSRLKESSAKATHTPIMEAIKAVLKEKTEPALIAELMEDARLATYKEGDEVKKMTTQKLSPMLYRLESEGVVEVTKQKKKSYFALKK